MLEESKDPKLFSMDLFVIQVMNKIFVCFNKLLHVERVVF